jgi:cellulose synthase/poly-beta-1,6-N-acetylglucosamine synthase-like glycosyltransferase
MDIPVWLIVIFAAYALPLLFIFFYSLTQVNLVYLCLKSGYRSIPGKIGQSKPNQPAEELPYVTVQLPVFNEMYVVERLLDSVSSFDYPKNRFEIQVLDDSTDDTSVLIGEKVKSLRCSGFDISHIKRDSRFGFKAGALSHGLKSAKGDFIAIFDADFLPSPDFLRVTIPYFADKQLGLVQTKWHHVNEDYSLLTRLQAFGLDAHFNVEQRGRNSGGYFINFNGTAGVWRKACILDAGDWQSDTLTEDLDISYRAQLRGWKFMYLDGENTPAELPVTMSALKTQQFRWTKGAAECAMKNLPSVLKSKSVPIAVKVHAFFHLTNGMVFPCILISSLLSIPFLFMKSSYPGHEGIYLFASFSLLSLLALGVYYWVSANMNKRPSVAGFVVRFVAFLSFSMGFSVHNSIAIVEGYMKKKIPFIRTPKYNISSSADSWKDKVYRVGGVDSIAFIEALLACYFMLGVFIGLYFAEYALLPFHVMLTLGFGGVAAYSFLQASAPQRTG